LEASEAFAVISTKQCLKVSSGTADGKKVDVVVLGSKPFGKFPHGFRTAAILESASVAEEVEGVLVQLTNTLAGLRHSGASGQPLRLTTFHHQAKGEAVRISVLFPVQQPGMAPRRFATPSHLYLKPIVFADGLIEQYLFARLHAALQLPHGRESDSR
jgi:hypothetical protein